MKKISRQIKWQRKMKEKGKYIKCGKYAIPEGTLCFEHWLKETFRRWDKCKKPNFNTKTTRTIQEMIDNYSLKPEQTNEALTKEMLNKHYDLYEKS